MAILKTLAFLALVAPSAPALADSDGYFCIGSDYFAYEISFSVAPPGHRLYLFRFNDPTQWKTPLRVSLPDFNGPPMRCEDNDIVLAGWEANHYVSWKSEAPEIMTLRSESKPPGPPDMDVSPDAIGSLVFGVGPRNPGVYSAELPSNDPAYRYELTVSRESGVVNRCIWHVRSFITQYMDGAVVDELELYAGQQPAECGK